MEPVQIGRDDSLLCTQLTATKVSAAMEPVQIGRDDEECPGYPGSEEQAAMEPVQIGRDDVACRTVCADVGSGRNGARPDRTG